ncbi:HepT-like ribonuclease domain-containing protein [Microvirga massiliensis]|uniref:HepT-like ribonuclease domain-containing protein n=1 Tax=Microvirga massiliensis TaxID=1033741 RepID=UPI00069C3DA2
MLRAAVSLSQIVAFRNVLIHGYASVDDRLVWDVVESRLPDLRARLEELLRDISDPLRES